MTKKLLAALMCVIMVMSLSPVTVQATITDISSSGLDLTSPPDEITTYKAGSGTVTWNPKISPATLTFNNATIEVSSSSHTSVIAITHSAKSE